MYIHIYPSTYNLCVQMIFTNNVLVNTWNGNYKPNSMKFVPHLIWYTGVHIRNDYICGVKQTPYNMINNVHLNHEINIRNENICGNGQILCKFVHNIVKLELY